VSIAQAPNPSRCPDVLIDIIHFERSLRAIPMGRKNWAFNWAEVGAKHIGIM
jgi:transposase